MRGVFPQSSLLLLVALAPLLRWSRWLERNSTNLFLFPDPQVPVGGGTGTHPVGRPRVAAVFKSFPFLLHNHHLAAATAAGAAYFCSNCHLYYACCLLRENCLLSLAEKLLTARSAANLPLLSSPYRSLSTSTCFLPLSVWLLAFVHVFNQ